MGYKLGFLILMIFFMGIFLFASISHYKNKNKQKYNMKNMMPYEFNYRSTFAENFWGNITFILSYICIICFYAFFQCNGDSTLTLVTRILGISSVIISALLFFLPLTIFKGHGFSFIFAFAISFATTGGIMLMAFNDLKNGVNGFNCTVFILECIIGLFMMSLLINPRLSFTIKADKSVNENGETIYTRPKFIPLAFTEWVIILSNYINVVLLFVLSINL